MYKNKVGSRKKKTVFGKIFTCCKLFATTHMFTNVWLIPSMWSFVYLKKFRKPHEFRSGYIMINYYRDNAHIRTQNLCEICVLYLFCLAWIHLQMVSGSVEFSTSLMFTSEGLFTNMLDSRWPVLTLQYNLSAQKWVTASWTFKAFSFESYLFNKCRK